MAEQIRVLTLEEGQNYEHKLYRVQKGWSIRFSLGSSFWYRNVKFFCNYPVEEDGQFDRNTYNLREWSKSDEGDERKDAKCTEIKIARAGVYQFYVEADDDAQKKCCNGYFLVDPTLKLVDQELYLDSIAMQTVICKLLGPFTNWKKQLAIAPECAYNMFHFSPMQQLGGSDSAYSIKDHHQLDARFSSDSAAFDLEKLANFVDKVHKSWGMLSIMDIVWNHVSTDCEWIKEHPEASYSLENSPHLKPAFLVDRALWYMNKDIMEGKFVDKGVPSEITNEEHLHCLGQIIRDMLHEIDLFDFFTIDIKALMDQFVDSFKKSGFPKKKHSTSGKFHLEDLEIKHDSGFSRMGCSVDIKHGVKSCFSLYDTNFSYDENMTNLCNAFRARLLRLNEDAENFVNSMQEKIVHNILGHVRYHFLDCNGPKYSKVSESHSISVRYFSYPFPDSSSWEDDFDMANSENACSIMAHNGWVMGYDAMKNFADRDSHSHVYLNRELIAWGDNIKLNYGKGPEDSPFVYQYMKEYTEQMAKIFHGFRIDNCHSTPIHVAEYLLDCARAIRPDLYVLAELFTNDEATDNTFINRLGINSLIRENLGACTSRDLGRHVHRYGGESVGSFVHPPVQPMKESVAHTVFMDLTHDNKSLFQARSVFDILPSSAMVTATNCGVGSTRGFDELVPHHIHVVDETRHYKPFSSKDNGNGVVRKGDGILRFKEALNVLHASLDEEGYSQIFVDQKTEDVCSVMRHNPKTHRSVVVVAHNAFNSPPNWCYPSVDRENKHQKDIPSVNLGGVMEEVVYEARLLEKEDKFEFVKEEKLINGSTNYVLELREHFPIEESQFCKLSQSGDQVDFVDFIPGSVIAFKVALDPHMDKAAQALKTVLAQFPNFSHMGPELPETPITAPFTMVAQNLDLEDLNRVLYRCGEEEKGEGWGGGVYNIPFYGDMVYCGLQGIMSVMENINFQNDLGHPLCKNLRDGDWLMDYTANRLKVHQGTLAVGQWFESVFGQMKQLPRYLIPSYFDAFITSAYSVCLDRAFELMSRSVRNGSSFYKNLSLVSLQMIGRGSRPTPPVVSEENDEIVRSSKSMAAGLPHFSFGNMRCWGRDTFISMRGLFYIPGRFELARQIILSFAGCLRHGLIPNLLDDGEKARYNSRDATWFWLQAIQDYCNMSEEGTAFLSAQVVRMYPTNSSVAQTENAPRMELQDVIQDVLMTHFQGMTFQERNAGDQLDRDMSADGFWQSIGVDMDTGFVFGGSPHNCGTWMDKMGSSHMSGNRGHPATPRDGSAVEIQGLLKSALKWLITAHDMGDYRYSAVVRTDEGGKLVTWSYEQWEKKVLENFEKIYYVTKESSEEGVHKREIYKDTHKSEAYFTDYQLRPNFPIAMCVAPELFVPEHAWAALANIEKHLLGPLGLKTLDPDDQRYNGYYENSVDCREYHKANGFNYHQGPEWIWILGPYLRARIYFSQLLQKREEFIHLITNTKKLLLNHYNHLMSSPWRGLTELTNKDGAYCHDSSPTQAWSAACLLEVLQYIDDCEADWKI